ncbi:MAG TPA: hypothetical protein VL049_18275 [Candidatus Dormibacteraeota bacterium]|nr:hypothetical protein [Candidatus Dormibacteraeota bacterium]
MPAADGRPSWVRNVVQLSLELVLFAALLFLTRFILRGYLALPLDEECHIGGIAVDVLAKGIRFPLMVYVQSDYDNGSLISGLLAAGSFSLLGRNLLALKLVTHLMAAIGAVAALALVRGCLRDLGLTSRPLRWTATAVLAIAIALAPEAMTLPAMCTVGIGSPLDGSVIDTLLLALFAQRVRDRSPLRIAVFWALVGVALFLNRATLPIIPALAVAEIVLARRAPRKLIAAGVGFLIGSSRDILLLAESYSAGWRRLLGKAHVHDIPGAFLDSVWTGSEYRLGLIAAWALAVAVGVALVIRSAATFRAWWTDDTTRPPWTLAVVVGAALMHIAALLVMATGGFDYYTIYSYQPVAVLLAVAVAWGCAQATAGRSPAAGVGICAAAVAVVLVLYRPLAMAPSLETVRSLWHNRTGAACSWRLAEGFRREYEAGLAPGETREQHVIDRCRSLSERDQVLDCVGGLARDLQHDFGGHIDGGPPAALTAEEARAFAYYYGVRRNGDAQPCADFSDGELRAHCAAAVQLDCIARGGWGSHFSATPSSPPRCDIPPPPIGGYWATLRTTIFTTTDGIGLRMFQRREEDVFPSCQPVFAACY